MNILIVSSYLPFPLYSGGNIRLYNLMKLLGQKHSITLICEMRDHQKKQDIYEVEKICKRVVTIPRKRQWSAKNIFSTGFSKNAFLVTGHTNLAMEDAINSILVTDSIDLIHVETSYVFQNLPKTNKPVLLVEHNIEYLVYQRYSDNASKLIRPLLQVDVLKLKKFEESAWKRATHVATVSMEEKKTIEKITPNVSVIPNGVNLDTYIMRSPITFLKNLEEKRLLFIGDFKWIQNKDAISWIVSEVWPLLLQKYANEKLKLWIVGNNVPEYIKAMKDPTILISDTPPSAVDVFHKTFLLLGVVRVKGGTSYKILEAMATGTPVVTTSLGIEGIIAEKDKDVIIADSPIAIVDSISRLFSDNHFYSALVVNGREKIERYYSWDTIAGELDKLYRKMTR